MGVLKHPEPLVGYATGAGMVYDGTAIMRVFIANKHAENLKELWNKNAWTIFS